MAKLISEFPDWSGDTVVILASGPSMSREVVEAVRGRARTIVTNTTFRLAPWADALYAPDVTWWEHPEYSDWKQFKGLKLTTMNATGGFVCRFDEVFYFRNGGSVGLSNRKDTVTTCMNGGHQAMHAAVNFGARRILLCGFDMRERVLKHWHQDHPDHLNKEIPFEAFIRLMTLSAPHFAKRGIEVLNCTPKSALKCYPFVSLEHALESMPVDKRPSAISA